MKVPYNPWYSSTYETILDIANWGRLDAEVDRKIVAIFSWMPQTLMSIRHRGLRFKFEIYTKEHVTESLAPVAGQFGVLQESRLAEFDLCGSNREILVRACEVLFPILGTVAGSKYLHFSAPKLIPMWDRKIRLGAGCRDSVEGFMDYVRTFKAELGNECNLQEALREYPNNAVRGWDIVRMKGRR